MLVLFRWWKQSWIIGSFLRLSSWSKLFWICRPTRRPLPMLINQFRFASSFSDKKPSFLLHHSLENMIKEPFWKLTQSWCFKITNIVSYCFNSKNLHLLTFEFSRQKWAKIEIFLAQKFKTQSFICTVVEKLLNVS